MCPVDDETVDLFNYLLFLRNLRGQLTEYPSKFRVVIQRDIGKSPPLYIYKFL